MYKKHIIINVVILVVGFICIALFGLTLTLGEFYGLFFALYSAYWTGFLILSNTCIGIYYTIKKQKQKKAYFLSAAMLFFFIILAILILEIV